MTPKEKFENLDILFEGQFSKIKYDEKMDCADNCEQIADEFAIEFAEWYLNLWRTDDDSSFDNNSPQELLEIFKKEKGL